MTTEPEDKMPDEEITDEMLMAYIDGDPELPPHRRRRIAAALPHSPALVKRMNSFIFTKGPVQRAFDETLVVPEWLIAAVTGEAKPAPKPRSRAGFLDVIRTARWRTVAMAAVGAMLIAGPAGWLLSEAMRNSSVDLDARGVMAAGSLRTALETTPSGTKVDVGAGVGLSPKATFANVHDQWCRQYVLTYRGDLEAPGLACRESGGNWRVLLQEAARPASPPGTILGSGQGLPVNPEGEAFDLYRDQLRKGNTLTADEERRLLREDRWTRKP